MSDLVPFFKEFEGHRFTFVEYDGRPAIIARELGAYLGYSDNGGALVHLIANEWKAEFKAGEHFVKVTGEELAALKAAGALAESDSGSRARHLVLLFEAGVNLVLLKSDKPEGAKVRAFLASEVMPSLARTGSYSLPSAKPDRLSIAAAREIRLAEQAKEAAKQRRINNNWRLVRELGSGIDPAYRQALLSDIDVINNDLPAPRLRPLLPGSLWLRPAQIGERYNCSPHRVGMIITELGWRTDHAIEGIKRLYAGVDTNGGNRSMWEYSPEAVEKMVPLIQKWREEVEAETAAKVIRLKAKKNGTPSLPGMEG